MGCCHFFCNIIIYIFFQTLFLVLAVVFLFFLFLKKLHRNLQLQSIFFFRKNIILFSYRNIQSAFHSFDIFLVVLCPYIVVGCQKECSCFFSVKFEKCLMGFVVVPAKESTSSQDTAGTADSQKKYIFLSCSFFLLWFQDWFQFCKHFFDGLISAFSLQTQTFFQDAFQSCIYCDTSLRRHEKYSIHGSYSSADGFLSGNSAVNNCAQCIYIRPWSLFAV